MADDTTKSLEEEIASYKAMIAAQEITIAAQTTTIDQQTTTITELKQTIEDLKQQFYGRKSEKRKKNSKQQEEKPSPNTPITEHTEARRNFLEDKLPEPPADAEVSPGILAAHLERVEEEIDTKPADWNQDDYEELSPRITERLVVIPAKVFVKRIIRRVYKRKSDAAILPVPPAPAHVFGRCSVDESVIIHIILNRFLYHIPYYRQEKMFSLMGVTISRENMIRWCNNLALLFAPIVDVLEQQVKSSPVVHVDETPFVGKAKKKKGYKRHLYFWPISAPEIGIVFRWTELRNKDIAAEVLSGIGEGTSVLADALSIYYACATEQGYVLQLCWAHIRRKFHEALGSNEHRATEGLTMIGALFHAEKEVLKAGTPEKILEGRQNTVKPLVDEFFAWLYQYKDTPEVVTDSKLRTAFNYVLNKESEAKHFLQNPLMLMHNNGSEREAKNFKLGAKNWLFTSSSEGADALCVFYSLIRTALMHNVHPFYYLLDLCQRIEQRGLNAIDLTPQNWKQLFEAQVVPKVYRNST